MAHTDILCMLTVMHIYPLDFTEYLIFQELHTQNCTLKTHVQVINLKRIRVLSS